MREERTWTDEELQRCLALHAGGMSYAKIGRILRRSKNSVACKLDRDGAPKRPNPALPRTAPAVPVTRAGKGVATLPPLPSEAG